ncbi:E3 ubiquitin/ISG15 ligase TRIM25-like isoform X2 [Betta splendens]|uniref:E3 ubiquitin/ISG15 ligase TRIM25-like isoform X2 n=1 Tax=Betta splendens TaxID=158456 RepID=A0A6P7LCG5_BETSP|nr:E3 ubiquitin/ISG15 ligase TRIM25-like isoform X2 [Betta splendens]
MADVEGSPFSITSLEDELTCSICLSTFDCPVTIPCGHNFCQDCLLATWKDSYSCPQCRTHFASRPELKKNTVLSTVVETFTMRSGRSDGGVFREEKERRAVIRCDTCMEAEASKTCLTCMASYCDEHLRPHRDNPNFSVHQLSEPVGDLMERICPDHHKLMELFCSQHSRPICSLCIQVHKGCSLMTPEEQRNLKESELLDKLGCLDRKIERTEAVMHQMQETQSKLKEGASKRKTALTALYQHMRDLLAQEERKAHVEVDSELEICHNKHRELTKRFTDNVETMRKARDEINTLLSRFQATAFLQASYELPKAVKCDPYVPRMNLDSRKVTAMQDFTNGLKQYLEETLNQPVEDRDPLTKPRPGATSTGPQREPEQAVYSTAHSPAPPPPPPPPVQPYFQTAPVPAFSRQPQVMWNPPQRGRGRGRGAPAGFRPPPFRAAQTKQSDAHHQNHHKQDKKQAPGGHKAGATGSQFTKTDKPGSHNPSKAGHHPQNKKK